MIGDDGVDFILVDSDRPRALEASLTDPIRERTLPASMPLELSKDHSSTASSLAMDENWRGDDGS